MMEAIFFTVMAIFCIIGIADLIRCLTAKILGEGKKQFILSLLPCRGHEEDIEFRIRHTYSRLNAQGKNCCILLVDYGMDEETKRICELIHGELDCVCICTEEEIPRFLLEKFHLQIA